MLMGAITELMSLYGRGAGVHAGRAYAEKDKNIVPILHPFVTLMATTTSTELMAVIKGADVDSGFLNRCMLFETAENIPPRQSPALDIDQKIIVALRHVGNGTYGGQASIKINGINFVPIIASSAALVLLDELADIADESMATPPYGALWARAYQNALIYSGLLALGCGGKLIITEEHAAYAIQLVKHCITRWTKKMKEESSESVFDAQMKKALKNIRQAKKYSHDKKYGDLCSQGLMPRSKLTNQMRLDKYQLNRIVDTLLQSEEIGQSEIGLSGEQQIMRLFSEIVRIESEKRFSD